MISGGVWRFASASVTGTSHERSGAPCQDYHACRVFREAANEGTMVIVVSDGAGSAPKSQVGSAISCQTVLEQVELFLAEGGTIGSLCEALACEWLDGVRQAIAEEARASECGMREYACTLLVAILGHDAAAFMQIGDGAIVVSDNNNDFCWVFWPARGEFANTTYFVTDKDAQDHLQFDVGPRRIQEAAVFTDGIEALVLHYATKSVHAPFFERIFTPVRTSRAAGHDVELARELESYLASPAVNSRTDDDKTLVIATRRPPEIATPVQFAAPSAPC